MKFKIPFITPIFWALQQSWYARKIIVNPVLTYLLFLKPSILGRNFIYKFRYKDCQLFSRWTDWVALEEVILRGEYDEVVKNLQDLDHPTILDLGANIGTFSIRAFQNNRDANVYAVEPSSETYKILQKNCQANPGLHWHTYRYALWDQDGYIDFEENSQASTGSHIGQSAEAVRVPAIRLTSLVETYIGQPIDLLKMDIEGAEEAVLFDSLDVLETVKTLILEIHPYRCNEAKIRDLLYGTFSNVYEITGRLSSKPLLVCSQTNIDIENALKVK